MSEPTVALRIPLLWHHVRTVRDSAAESLGFLSTELREAAAMSAAELVENAIKYGDEVPAMPTIEFAMTVNEDAIVITVKNGCNSSAGVAELCSRIDQLNAADDPGELYLRRLEQLMQDPSDSGQLGIFRIGFEGRFKLEAAYDDGVVTVSASRAIKG